MLPAWFPVLLRSSTARPVARHAPRSRALGVAALLAISLEPPGDPPNRAPAADAPRQQVFSWSSQGGLRFSWRLPPQYDGSIPCDLTVVLHGRGESWGFAHEQLAPDVFRPHDVVIGVEGTSEGPGAQRRFIPWNGDAQRFQSFLEELAQLFRVERTFLYGHDDGGTFALFFAGQPKASVAGAVAQGARTLEWAGTSPNLRQVPVVFLHGTNDLEVPYSESFRSRGLLLERWNGRGKGKDPKRESRPELVHLRRMPGYGHDANAVRADEAITWCQGMQASTPEEALACAKELLRVKPADAYHYEMAVDFSGARAILARFGGTRKRNFQVSGALADDVHEWTGAIDGAAEDALAPLKKKLRKGLVLDGGAWLGELVLLREELRGVPALEAWVQELGFDALQEQHELAAEQLLATWRQAKTPEPALAAVAGSIGAAFLADGFPDAFTTQVDEWLRQDLELPPELAKKLGDYADWKKGWREGSKEYERFWRRWKGPEAGTKR